MRINEKKIETEAQLQRGEEAIQHCKRLEHRLSREKEVRKNGADIELTKRLVKKVTEDQEKIEKLLQNACVNPDFYIKDKDKKESFIKTLDSLLCNNCKTKLVSNTDGKAALNCIQKHIEENSI